MKSKRLSIVVPVAPPRNPVLAILKTRKGGRHGPSEKAQRKRANQNMMRNLRDSNNGADGSVSFLWSAIKTGWTCFPGCR